MLLCALSPAITTWNEDFIYATEGGDEKKIYVSIGDSTTNGYGLDGYYDNGNVYGFLRDVKSSYPHKVVETLGEDWELTQLATSSMRMEELALMLGNEAEEEEHLKNDGLYLGFFTGYVNVMHSATGCDVAHADAEWIKAKKLNRETLECVQSFYQKKVSENEFERRVAYEVSVSKLECVGEEE